MASLRLTVFCLGVSMVLVFAATLDQVNLGIHAVEKKYLRSLFALWQIPGVSFAYLPLPGGYFLGGVLLINLIAAHVTRFKMSWKKLGIMMIHVGVILLIVGEISRGLLADETRMRLVEGETKSYSEAPREAELAIIDTSSDTETDRVVAIPERMLQSGVIQHPALPFTVHVRDYFPNSELQSRLEVPEAPPSMATTGFGVRTHVIPRPRATKLNEIDLPSGFVELRSAGETLGTWLVSSGWDEEQSFQFEDKVYRMALRFRRDYKPFAIKLLEFTRETHAGTEIPSHFASRVLLQQGKQSEDREIVIYMNNPLRHGGYTFYQSGAPNDETTILQVVKNPAWMLPYFACGILTLGMLWQFSLHLVRFASSRPRSS